MLNITRIRNKTDSQSSDSSISDESNLLEINKEDFKAEFDEEEAATFQNDGKLEEGSYHLMVNIHQKNNKCNDKNDCESNITSYADGNNYYTKKMQQDDNKQNAFNQENNIKTSTSKVLNQSLQELKMKANLEFFYSGNHIIKLWEQHLKRIDPNIKFYSNGKVVDSIFYNGLQQIKEVVIVLNNDNTPYLNKNNQTITLCGEIKYHGDSVKNNIAEAIEQILIYNEQEDNHTKITNHIIIFPYQPSCFHWNLGKIEFLIQENTIISVLINIYEPFGSQNTKSEHYLQNVIQQLSSLQDDIFIENKLNQPKQQNDATSCGAITAENGKEFLNKSNFNDLLSVIYPAGAEDLRKQHISEINDDNFYKAQLENREYVAKGDEQLTNAAEILVALKLLIGKGENNWVKDILLNIKSIHNNIKANSRDNKNKNEKLDLFKEFLIAHHSSHELEDKILNRIIKNNLQWHDGSIDLIMTLAGSVVVQDENIVMNVGNIMKKSSILKFNSIDSTVDVQLENFRRNKPVTITGITPLQQPKYTRTHLSSAGFSGSVYQLLVLIDKLIELLIKNESFEAMVEADDAGNLDDVVILMKNQDAVTDIEAYQVKHYNHLITAHNFFNKPDKKDKAGKTENAKNNKMHIGKFLDGWLEWKSKYPNLPKENLVCILYSNAILDNILIQCITPEGKFKEKFIDGSINVSVNNKSDKPVIVDKDFLTKSKNIQFSKGFSYEIHSHLNKEKFLDNKVGEKKLRFTEKYVPSLTASDLGLFSTNLPKNKIKKNSEEIIAEIMNQLISLYNLNQVDLLELLYKQAFSYLDKKYKLHLMPKEIENNNSLAKKNKVYIKSNGLYITNYQGNIYAGSLLEGEFCNSKIDLDNLSEKLSDQSFKEQILNITSKRGHTQYYTEEVNRKEVFKNFLQSFQFYIGQYSIEKLEEEIQKKIEIILRKVEYQNTPYQVSTVYLSLYYAIHDWFRREYANKQAPKLTKDLMLYFLKQALICNQDIVFLQGQSEAILQDINSKINHPLVFRSELDNLKEMLNKPGFVLVKGESGIGKSTLVKQALKDNVPRGEYLILSGKNIANNPDLQNKFLNVLKEARSFQVVVIDGAEHLNISSQLKDILNIMEILKLTVLLTIADNINKDKLNDLEKLIPGKQLVLQVKPLNQQEILKVHPELTEFQKVISLVELAKIPFYLNIIIEQKNNIDLNFAASAPAKLKSYIISLQIKEKEWLHSINKSETLLQRFANKSLAASEIIFDIPRNFKIIAETLIRKGILIKTDTKKCMFSHDIYYNWAVDSWITSEFTKYVEIFDDWNQFLDQYSSYDLGNWFKENIESIYNHLVNFNITSLSLNSTEKLLWLISVTINLDLNAKTGGILSSLLYDIGKDVNEKIQWERVKIKEGIPIRERITSGKLSLYNTKYYERYRFVKKFNNSIKTENQLTKIFQDACKYQFLNFKHPDNRFIHLLKNIKNNKFTKAGKDLIEGDMFISFNCEHYLKERTPFEKQTIDLLFMPTLYEAMCQFNPDLFIELLQKNFLLPRPLDYAKYSFGKIEHYFGLLNYNVILDNYLTADYNLNPFFLLLNYNGSKILPSIINFINEACEKFANSGYQKLSLLYPSDKAKDEVINIKFVTYQGKEINLKGNQLLWALYREHGQPNVIKLALMSIELWLIHKIKQGQVQEVESILESIVECSTTVATIAVVSSVCIFAKESLGIKALCLLKHRQFFEWDQKRRLDDILSEEFRKVDLEQLALYLYAYCRNIEILDIIDQHYSYLPEIDKQTEQDKYWRIILCRMDIRKYQVVNRYNITGSFDKLIEMLPMLDDDLNEFLASNKAKRLHDNNKFKDKMSRDNKIKLVAELLINPSSCLNDKELKWCKKIIFKAIMINANSDEHSIKRRLDSNAHVIAECLAKLFFIHSANNEFPFEIKQSLVWGLTHASDAMKIAIAASISPLLWKQDPIFASKCIIALFKLAILEFKNSYFSYFKNESFKYLNELEHLRVWLLNDEDFQEEAVEFKFSMNEYNNKFSLIGKNQFEQGKIIGLALFLASYNFKNKISKKLYFAYLDEIIVCKYNPLKKLNLDINFAPVGVSSNSFFPFWISGVLGKFLITLSFDEAKTKIEAMISQVNWMNIHSRDYELYSTNNDFIQDILESLLKSEANPHGFWRLWNYLFNKKTIRNALLNVFVDYKLVNYINELDTYNQFVIMISKNVIKQSMTSDLFEKWLILAQRISDKNILEVIKIINKFLERNPSFISNDNIQDNILNTLIIIFYKNKSCIEHDQLIKTDLLFLVKRFSKNFIPAGKFHAELIDCFNQFQKQMLSTRVDVQSLIPNSNTPDGQSRRYFSDNKRTYSAMNTSNNDMHSMSTQTKDSTSQYLNFGNTIENNHEEVKHDFKRQRKNSDFKLSQFELSKKQEKSFDSFVGNACEERNFWSSQSFEVVKVPTITSQEANCTMLPSYSQQLDHNGRVYSIESELPSKNLIDQNFLNSFDDDFNNFDFQ